jgi:hypothetical protein
VLNLGELFSDTTGFMTVIQGQVIGIHNYKKYILDTNNNNNNNNNNETCKKCRQKSETSQHIAGACRALSQGDHYCRHHKQPKSLIRNWLSGGRCPSDSNTVL